MEPQENEKKPPLEQTLKPVKSLRTFQGDVEEAITKNNFSSKDIFLAEQKKRADNSDRLTPQNPELKNKLYLTLGSVLLALGIFAVGFVYYLRSNEEVVVQQKTKALLSFTEVETLSTTNITHEKFINEILKQKAAFSSPVNSILYLDILNSSNETADTESVLALLAPRMPGSLSRSFTSKYMFGIFSFDTNEPFIILTTDDLALSFAGMLKWEKDMASDLGKLFNLSQSASSTPRNFSDLERKNKDLRVLRDEEGRIVLLYSFIDTNTLLITKNENIFSALLSRFLITQQEK